MSVYIPSPDLLFKMMRACIGCQSIKDLWIYNETFNPVTEQDLEDDYDDEYGPQEA